ncbi:hypothetical protein chiPu_0033100, partial [Chiloscyllium punctatum]|nr:hypothetical protein [Chiloscyllium punctatum]
SPRWSATLRPRRGHHRRRRPNLSRLRSALLLRPDLLRPELLRPDPARNHRREGRLSGPLPPCRWWRVSLSQSSPRSRPMVREPSWLSPAGCRSSLQRHHRVRMIRRFPRRALHLPFKLPRRRPLHRNRRRRLRPRRRRLHRRRRRTPRRKLLRRLRSKPNC